MQGEWVKVKYMSDLTALVVAAQQSDAPRPARFHQEQQRHRLDAIVSPIDKVALRQRIGSAQLAESEERASEGGESERGRSEAAREARASVGALAQGSGGSAGVGECGSGGSEARRTMKM